MARKQRNSVKNQNYQGKYVAFDPSDREKVVASGSNAGTVIKKARQKGIEIPTIVFVPKDNMTYLY